MRASPKTRPSKPSSGTAPSQRRRPGRRSSSAGTNVRSQIPPSNFAIGETTFRDRNQRIPSPKANIGSRNAPIPKNCKSRSEPKAPTMPIQFRATREPVSTEALFSDGSSGEYEASARKRRSAETHKMKPSSSFSRRLLVGLKMRAINFIGNCMWRGQPTDEAAPTPHPTPEPDNYDKNQFRRQCRSLGQYRVRT